MGELSKRVEEVEKNFLRLTKILEVVVLHVENEKPADERVANLEEQLISLIQRVEKLENKGLTEMQEKAIAETLQNQEKDMDSKLQKHRSFQVNINNTTIAEINSLLSELEEKSGIKLEKLPKLKLAHG